MKRDRQIIPASEFCASVRDGTHDSPKQKSKGRFLVTSRHITTGNIDLSNAYFISQEDYDEINKRSKVDKWDVLISMIGTVGEACLIKEEPEFAIKNIGLFKNHGETQGKWLYYYLRSSEAQQKIKERSRGTTQQYIPLGELRSFPILVPTDPKEMAAIVSILSTLDDKIELNRRMNKTLEAMARAIFKSWFVDFDPVRAKAEGREPEGMDAATAALFPDGFVDSELGEVPRGWDVTTWVEVASLEYGKRLTGYQSGNGDFPVYGTNGQIGWHAKPLCQHPGVIIGRKGAYRGVHFSDSPFYVIDTAFFLQSKCKMSLRWAYYTLSGYNINDMDSGSAIPSTSRDAFNQISIVFPPESLQQAFDSLLQPSWDRKKYNVLESDTVIKIRDTLLPKLLSGEIRVKDAEPYIKEAI